MDEDITDLNLRSMVNAVSVASENIYNANQVEQPAEIQTSTEELKWSQDEDNFDSEMQQLIPTATQIDNSFEEASFEVNEEVVETADGTVSQFVKADPSTSQTDDSDRQLERENQTAVEQTCMNEEGNVENGTNVDDVINDSNADEIIKANDVTENDSENAKENENEKVELENYLLKEDEIDDVVIIVENEKEEKLEKKRVSKRKSKVETPIAPKKKVDYTKKCRICMEDNPTVSLFKSRDPVPGNEKMVACSAIQITEDDGLPQYICRTCNTNLNIAYQLKILCEKSDLMFREMLGVKNKTIVKRELILLDCISDSSDDMSIATYKARKKKSTVDSDGDYSPSKSKKNRKKIADEIPVMLSNKAIKLNHVAQAAIMTPKYVCKHCNKVFVRVETYNNHMETHKVNKYKCPSCSESFKTEKAQQIHTKMAHAVMPKIKYKCSKCDQEYELMRHLKIHEASHNREKKYKCDVCSGIFTNLVGLTQHKKEKHQAEQRTFQCTTCNLRFRSEDAVKRHAQLAHTTKSSQEKKPLSTRDLFKSIAPLTSTYWSDSYSD